MKWALVLGLVSVFACASRPQPPPAPPRTTKLHLPIKHFELKNGLKVVLVEDPKAAEVQVTMRYRVGAIDDPIGQEGMAHLVEHLMFEQVLGGQSLWAQLQTIATFSNAMTTFDATTYISRARTDRLEQLLTIEAVRVGFRCTSITDVVFERERSVVINELRQRDRVVDAMAALHGGTYPDGHPYQRTVIGTEQTVGAITREQACAFADAHYATKNAVLVISGDITNERVATALERFLARVPSRPTAARREVPAVTFTGKRTSVSGPVDDKVLVVSWAVPRDPSARAKFRTVVGLASQWIDSNIKGKVLQIPLGDAAAPLLALVVTLGSNETLDQAMSGVTRGLEDLPKDLERLGVEGLGQIAYDKIRQSAAHGVFAQLEDGHRRDVALATDVLAGFEPRVALVGELAGLRGLDKAELVRIARDELRLDRSSIVILEPRTTGPKSELRLTPPVHDLAERRDAPDPATAHKPLERDLGARAVQMKTRSLPNGLQVVLIPASSIPTLDIRLVFHAGTADEPRGRLGSAILAARGLTWQPFHLNDLLLFAAAGGVHSVAIDVDHTEFGVRGMDMHIDALLAGLRRLVRDGWYGAAGTVVASFRAQAKSSRDTDSIDDAWRTALFGANHPYVMAGSIRHVSRDLDNTDADTFRREHFTPDNATLIISGGFDPALADRWIDYLFADWRGSSIARSGGRARLEPKSLARDEKGSLLSLAIAMPAGTRPRAEQLVLAQMLSQIAFDVREQLGASYDLSAFLHESRLATFYALDGMVEATRAADAIGLIRTRLEQLRSDPDAAARAFARARETVATKLAAIPNGATALSTRVARDFALGHLAMTDLDTAFAVRKLTLGSIDLGELVLDRAAILMRGPSTEIDRAFAVLGRAPTYVQPDVPVKLPDGAGLPPWRVKLPEGDSLTVPLTYQASRHRRVLLGLEVGYSAGTVKALTVLGPTAIANVGYRWDRHVVMGAQLVVGSLEGQYPSSSAIVPPGTPIAVVPVSVFASVQTWGDRFWGGLGVGLHVDRVTDGAAFPVWETTVGLAINAGCEIVRTHDHHFALFGRLDTAPFSNVSFSAFTGGAAWRW